MKARQQTVFDRLHLAADEIVGTARSAIKASGDSHPERTPLYLPILIAGTDMRICIESGPPIAASNAIHQAMGKSGQAPGLTFMDAVRRATDLLSIDARRLCADNTNPEGKWIDDTMREHHGQMLEVVDALHRGR
ncbi:MAG: hypothetical protein Q8M09_08240 [Pseudomonadota bacterium]|nr:hypothetical protein [Pseudomonadota bacterium]MDP1904218.1 hypothetical protein [Pseudomonadota bacterium]